jgi:hypothetical protein
MVKAFPFIALFGDSFSPTKIERETGLKFNKKNEVGDIGQRGRFKGKPYPFGHAILEAPEEIENGEKLAWLLDKILPYKEVLNRLGVTHGKVHITYAYDSQCNLEYEPQIMEKITKLGFIFTITCYQDESEFEGENPVDG